jgi:hypothetical protein
VRGRARRPDLRDVDPPIAQLARVLAREEGCEQHREQSDNAIVTLRHRRTSSAR